MHVKYPPTCLWVCKRRRSIVKKSPRKALSRLKWKGRALLFLLIFNDLLLVGSNMTQPQSNNFDSHSSSTVDESAFEIALMQLPGSGSRTNVLEQNRFPHLGDDLVQHHIMQWESPIRSVLRKRGHQFRCLSEYIFATKIASVEWTGWCVPEPPIKKFKGEATSLATTIIRRGDLRDVALDIQVRKGVPASVALYASVLRVPKRMTRQMFVDRLLDHLERKLALPRNVDFVFYKGRVWPAESDLVIQTSHCDTFVIMSHQQDEQDDLVNEPAHERQGSCEGEHHEEVRRPGELQVSEEEEELSEVASQDSFTPDDFGLFTFIVGTEQGVMRYDTSFRQDITNDMIMELLATYLRCDVVSQEITAAPSLVVDRQRIFIVLHEDDRGSYLTLQRRFEGFEKESFRIVQLQGELRYDDYLRHFLSDNPLEVYLGDSPWSSSTYRMAQPGSVVTALFPDPAGGAYRFDVNPQGINLLQVKWEVRKRASQSSFRALGNVEDATRDPCFGNCSLSVWDSPFMDVFKRLPPPGNPEQQEVELSLQLERSSADGTVEEAQHFGRGSPGPLVVSDEESDLIEEVVETETSIPAKVPSGIGEALRLLTPWMARPLSLDFPEDFTAPAIAEQFILNCCEGWSDRIQTIHIYTDGSSKLKEEDKEASFAFTVFGCDLRMKPHHFFLGWFAHKVITSPDHPHFTGACHKNAKEAETSALLWANVWLLQSGIRCPTFFHYDAIIVGNAMTGAWQVRSDWTQGNKLRELVLFSQALRAGCEHHYEHCKAHSLQPCNEITDSLARLSCDNMAPIHEVDPSINWGTLFHAGDNKLSWAWWNVSYFFGQEYPEKHGDTLSISKPNIGTEVTAIGSLHQSRTFCGKKIFFAIRVGSYNTMTLHSKQDDGSIIMESTRAAMLRKQLAEQEYHIIGLQETRCNLQTIFSSEDYIRLTSGSDVDRPGHWGCELWFRRGRPFASTEDGQKLAIDAKYLTVLLSHPRLLVVHMKVGGQSTVVVSAHAPHEGSPPEEKDAWWTMLRKVCGNYQKLGRWIIMGDFNARLGPSHSHSVGDLVFDDMDNDNGNRLLSLCSDYHLWLPSTHGDYHYGPSFTWTHPKGNRVRLDFILLSSCTWDSVTSFVDYDIVTSNSVRDHELVGQDLQWTLEEYAPLTKTARYDWEKMHTPEGRNLLQQLVMDLPDVSWDTDIHAHWQILEDALHNGLQQAFPPRPKPTRADIFSSTTWDLRNRKREIKNNFVPLDEAMDDVYLWICWQSWKTQQPIDSIRRSASLLVMVVELARLHNLGAFRAIARKLRISLGVDKALFLESVVKEAGKYKGADIFRALRPLRIGSALRKRGIRTLPYLINKEGTVAIDEEARDQMWNDHCATMEAGVATSTHRLLQRTRRRTTQAFQTMEQSDLHLDNVHTLVELEGCFRRVKPRKAAGADGFRSDVCAIAAAQLARKFHPVLTKMYLRGEEPLQMKGGLLISAFKGGKHTEVENYRSLLLSSHLGKALRRTIRQRLVPFYAENANAFHCSVKQGGSVSHASQGLQLILSAARRKHVSAGVIFLDVKAAYYRVVRELVVDMQDDLRSFERLLHYFQLGDTEESQLLAAVADGSAADALQIPRHLQNLLRESLSNTWFVTEQRNSIFECLAGSRPGDGLADVVFALIFRKILSCVQDDFKQQFEDVKVVDTPEFDPLEEEPPTTDIPGFLDIVWADDLAIVVSHKKPLEMIERLRYVTSRIFHHCLRHALIPNLKKGKTEAMLFIRGAGSRAIRGQFFNEEDPFLEIYEVPEAFSKVVVSSGYKHLGSRIHLGRGIMPEIKARLGAASTIYRKHRRAIFQNRLLSLERRRYLFNTMVLSIVRYNTGTWGPLSVAEKKYFNSRMLSMYRGLLRADHPELQLRMWNNHMVLAAVGLPDPMFFLYEAKLSFAISAVRSGPRFLWTLAAAEEKWLSSLRESKQWLHSNLKGNGPDRFGAMWNPNYMEELTMRPDGFKRWIRRASEHAKLQHRIQTHWNEWHHEFLYHLTQNGLQLPFPWPSGGDFDTDSRAEACLSCHRIFANRAAWSVHAIKVHQRTNDKRELIHNTRCEVCMREYRSLDRLQRHLNHSTGCAVQLRQAGLFFHIQPGINSNAQKQPSGFPIPILPSEGPSRDWPQPGQVEWDNGIIEEFVETLLQCAQGLRQYHSFQTSVAAFKEVFRNTTWAFSDLVKTFRFFCQETRVHWEDIREAGSVPLSILDDTLTWIERRLSLQWFFSEQECRALPNAEELRLAAWKYCDEKARCDLEGRWAAECTIPRFGSRQLTFLHFFSGELRAGDLQEALGAIDIPSGYTRVILAVDIIFDAIRGDLTVKATQDKWINYIRRGLIDAIFSGPPCESWSKSRQDGGIPECTTGDGGPRMIRLASRPQGLASLRVREASQVLLANILLLYTLTAFFEMLLMGKFAMVEHPATPDGEEERWLPSIWRLLITRYLRCHPGVQSALIFQGFYRAKSPKPTLLMFACGNKIRVENILTDNRVTSRLPRSLKMGMVDGEYATASLKNYPSGLCRALAQVLQQWLFLHVKHLDSEPPIPQEELQHFMEYVQLLRVNFNFAAQRGADCAMWSPMRTPLISRVVTDTNASKKKKKLTITAKADF